MKMNNDKLAHSDKLFDELSRLIEQSKSQVTTQINSGIVMLY